MQQIEVEMVGAQAPEARLAGTCDALSRDFVGLDLGNQVDAITLSGNRFVDEFLGAAAAVIARGIDQRHAERNARAQRLLLNLSRMPSLTEMPATLAERRDGNAVRKPHRAPGGIRWGVGGGSRSCISMQGERSAQGG